MILPFTKRVSILFSGLNVFYFVILLVMLRNLKNWMKPFMSLDRNFLEAFNFDEQ